MFKSYGDEDSRLFGGNEPEMPSIVVKIFCRWSEEGKGEDEIAEAAAEKKKKEQRT